MFLGTKLLSPNAIGNSWAEQHKVSIHTAGPLRALPVQPSCETPRGGSGSLFPGLFGNLLPLSFVEEMFQEYSVGKNEVQIPHVEFTFTVFCDWVLPPWENPINCLRRVSAVTENNQ